ncbi:MAG TPA: phenylalanine--tRNA ligase subunit beta [Candidatus Poseidoniales archaeon]|nr:MAG TPA: phenylalanine--tRNA ligase subunit beta [Candidatus Poseidoniales archaeon]HII24138.1 phenylalanine--tRNA ligase subunit beta [Candidatus Poseidoniaceae archaeon]|tara:strand:- start:2144 stop:3889 length:1746 start_codon:yes stop_codon:yes gene_type:complete
MPTISVDQKLLTSLLSRHGCRHDIADVDHRLPLLGTDIDRCDEEVLDIEIFPNRPDLLSAETLSLAMRGFLHNQPTLANESLESSGITLSVEPELATIRPIILGAVVRGLDMDDDDEMDEFIKQLMDHQEKLHFALGRGRRRASIGVHDLTTLKPPFTVKAVERSHSFIPLAMEHAMTIDEILASHPKGVDYAHLLDGMDKVPIIEDAEGAVLSFPPIINGVHTTVQSSTRDLFIDVTGWDRRACESCLMLVALQAKERGGSVQTIQIIDCEGKQEVLPNWTPVHHRVPARLITTILGRDLNDDELSNAMLRMGGAFTGRSPATSDEISRSKSMQYASEGEDMFGFDMPRWRFDLLHPVDIVEDIAIGHGYEDLGTDVPKAPMNAIPRADDNLRRRIRTSMQGMGFMQIQSLTLSNDEDQFNRMRWKPFNEITRITNPITLEHTMMRHFLLPGLLRLLASNRHHDLPQSVYELGTVVRDHKNMDRLAFLTAERIGGFASIRGRIQAFLRDIGAENVVIEPLPDNEGPWLAGRSAKILLDGEWVGCFGEIDPSVSQIFELLVPLNGAEFDVEALKSSITDPV